MDTGKPLLNYVIESLRKGHHGRGLEETLSELRPTPELSEAAFEDIRLSVLVGGTKTIVAVDTDTRRIIGTASVIIEHKFLHGGSKIAHVEDVAVLKKCQGNGVGKALIRVCEALAVAQGCYKMVLDCDDKNVEYYEACGMHKTRECHMRIDFRKPGP